MAKGRKVAAQWQQMTRQENLEGQSQVRRQEKYYKSTQSGESVKKCEPQAFILSKGLPPMPAKLVTLLTCPIGLNKFC